MGANRNNRGGSSKPGPRTRESRQQKRDKPLARAGQMDRANARLAAMSTRR